MQNTICTYLNISKNFNLRSSATLELNDKEIYQMHTKEKPRKMPLGSLVGQWDKDTLESEYEKDVNTEELRIS